MKRATIRPELYKTRLNKSGFAPIRLVCQYRQDRKIIPTEIKLRPANWNVRDRAAMYIKPNEFRKLLNDPNNLLPSSYSLMPLEKDILAINNQLQEYVNRLQSVEDGLLKKGNYTIADIVKEYKKQYDNNGIVASDPQHSVIDFVDNYVKQNEGIIKFRTLQAYNNLNNHLKAYAKKKKDNPSFEKMTYAKMKAIHAYLIEKDINNTTIAKLISTLKTLIKAAIRENTEIKACPDFRDYTVNRKDGDNEVIALAQDEFNALLDLDLSDPNKQDYYNAGNEKVGVSFRTLDRARDLFLFSCVTGLRYSDVASLKREHIRDGFIFKKAVKTGQSLSIPLNNISAFILAKYSDQLEPLPVISNQRVNDYIKTLGRMAGINATMEKSREYGTEVRSTIYKKYELMTFHMGRRTFATLTLEKGAGMQDVMSLTGHKKYASFKRYMDITPKQKQKAMSVWDRENKESNNLKIAK